MTKNNKNQSSFSILKITTEQFAIFDLEEINEDNLTGLKTKIQYGLDFENQTIIIIPSFIFSQNKTPFLIIEVACSFKLEKHLWELFNQDKNIVIVPKKVMMHFSSIAIGTIRGVLHTKTENTKYNRFIIPPVNILELVKDDIQLQRT